MCVSGCDNETGANFATIQYSKIRALFKKKSTDAPTQFPLCHKVYSKGKRDSSKDSRKLCLSID